MTIENIPSENPKTGRITALSVIAPFVRSTRRCASAPKLFCYRYATQL